MPERKYSISEIDRMRNAIRQRISNERAGIGFYGVERDAEIENMLRTHMLNGTDPEELEKVADEVAFRCLKELSERNRS